MPFFFLIFRLQKFESDSEEDDATVASPAVQVKEEPLANESVLTADDIEMLSAEDVGNNVTICHDTDVTERMDENFDEIKTEFESNTNTNI